MLLTPPHLVLLGVIRTDPGYRTSSVSLSWHVACYLDCTGVETTLCAIDPAKNQELFEAKTSHINCFNISRISLVPASVIWIIGVREWYVVGGCDSKSGENVVQF